MTRAPCRGRTGEALPRAEKFGDLITADHKVLNEGCESRDNPVRCRDTRSRHSVEIGVTCVKRSLHMRRRKVC